MVHVCVQRWDMDRKQRWDAQHASHSGILFKCMQCTLTVLSPNSNGIVSRTLLSMGVDIGLHSLSFSFLLSIATLQTLQGLYDYNSRYFTLVFASLPYRP